MKANREQGHRWKSLLSREGRELRLQSVGEFGECEYGELVLSCAMNGKKGVFRSDADKAASILQTKSNFVFAAVN